MGPRKPPDEDGISDPAARSILILQNSHNRDNKRLGRMADRKQRARGKRGIRASVGSPQAPFAKRERGLG